jgi:hypothetical protein
MIVVLMIYIIITFNSYINILKLFYRKKLIRSIQIPIIMAHTISIDDNIWEKAKIEAEKREISTNEIVKQALETYLSIDTKKLPLNTEEL